MEPKLVGSLLREHKMPDVRWVESAPENTDRRDRDLQFYDRTWPSPWTTYLNVVSSRRPIGPLA